MLRFLATLYHILIALVAVSMRLAVILVVTYILAEGILAYFFDIELLDWFQRATGVDVEDFLVKDRENGDAP